MNPSAYLAICSVCNLCSVSVAFNGCNQKTADAFQNWGDFECVMRIVSVICILNVAFGFVLKKNGFGGECI